MTSAVKVPPPPRDDPPPASGLLSPSSSSLRIRTPSVRRDHEDGDGVGGSSPRSPGRGGIRSPGGGESAPPLQTFGAGGRYVRSRNIDGEEVFLDRYTGKEHSHDKVQSVEFLVALMVGRHFEPRVLGDKVKELSGVRGPKAGTVAKLAEKSATAPAQQAAPDEGGHAAEEGGVPTATKIQQAAEESALLSELESLQSRHDRALWRAVAQGAMRRVRSLLQQGQGQVHWPNAAEYGYSCLHKAAQAGDHDILALLLQLGGGDVNVGTPGGGVTPLHVACWRGHTRACRLLLAAGALVSSRDAFHDTPLHDACEGGHGMIVRMLLTAPSAGKVVIDPPNVQGWTPLHKAAASGHAQCLGELLSSILRTAVAGALERVREESHAIKQRIQQEVRSAMLEEEQRHRAEARAAAQRARRLGARQAEAEQIAASNEERTSGNNSLDDVAHATTRSIQDRTFSAQQQGQEAHAALERSGDLQALLVSQRHGARPVSSAEVFFIAVTYAAWAFHAQMAPQSAGRKGGGRDDDIVPLVEPESHAEAMRVVARLNATLHEQAASGKSAGLTARQRATVRATRVPPPRLSELLQTAAEHLVQPPAVQSAAAFASTGLHTTLLGRSFANSGVPARNTLELQGGCPSSTPALLQCLVRSTKQVEGKNRQIEAEHMRTEVRAMGGTATSSTAARAAMAATGGHSAHQLATLGQHGACVGVLELAVRCILAGQSHAEGILAGRVAPEHPPLVQAVSRWGRDGSADEIAAAADSAPGGDGDGNSLPMSASMANILEVIGKTGATGTPAVHQGSEGGGAEGGVDFTWEDAEALADADLSLVNSIGILEEGGEGGGMAAASMGSLFPVDGDDGGVGSGLVGAVSLLRRQRSQRRAEADAAAAERAALLRRSSQAKLVAAALSEGFPIPSEGGGASQWRGGANLLRGTSSFWSQASSGSAASPRARGIWVASRRQSSGAVSARAGGASPAVQARLDVGSPLQRSRQLRSARAGVAGSGGSSAAEHSQSDTATFLTRMPHS